MVEVLLNVSTVGLIVIIVYSQLVTFGIVKSDKN